MPFILYFCVFAPIMAKNLLYILSQFLEKKNAKKALNRLKKKIKQIKQLYTYLDELYCKS